MTTTTPRWRRIRDLIRAARNHAKAVGRTKRADAWQKALDAAPGKPQPKPAPPSAMGWMPGVIHKPLPLGASDPPIVPVSVVQHVSVSNADSLFDLFLNDGGIEAHFYVRKDGTIEQYRSIFRQADAQFDSNHPLMGAVSVEHQGGVGADLFAPMPKVQLDAFHRVILFVASQCPGFRFQVCPDFDKPGVGYHAMFSEWNLNHHSCPGPARIKQFNAETVPWLVAQSRLQVRS